MTEGRDTLGARIFAALGSARLAAVLIVCLVGLSLLSVIVPQASYMGQERMADFARRAPELALLAGRLGLTDLFGGWPFALLCGLLALNVTVCTTRRMTRRSRRLAEVRAAEQTAGPSELTDLLRAGGWEVRVASESKVLAVKGLAGFWGSVTLHLGILVVIAGGVLAALTTFSGTLVLAETQTVSDTAASYLSIARSPIIGDAYTGAEIGLRSMDVRYEQGQRVDVVARVTVAQPPGPTHEVDVRVNDPVEVAGKTYLLEQSGLAPQLGLSGPAGTESRVVNLAERTPFGWRDSVALGEIRPGKGVATAEMTTTPVPLAAGVAMPPEELRIADPRLELTVKDSGGVLFAGTLAPGATAELAPGVALTFEDVLLWTRFMVRSSPGRWVIYAGFWLCVFGTLWRLAVPERRLTIRLADGEVTAVAYRVWPFQLLPHQADARLIAGISPADHS